MPIYRPAIVHFNVTQKAAHTPEEREEAASHAGFGLGIERVLMWICKLEHIRGATPFPRVMNRASP